MIKHITFAKLTLNQPSTEITPEMISRYFVDIFSTYVSEKMKLSVEEETPTSITHTAEVVIMSTTELISILADARAQGMEEYSEMVKKIYDPV